MPVTKYFFGSSTPVRHMVPSVRILYSKWRCDVPICNILPERVKSRPYFDSLKRRGKEDIFGGYYGGENRVVIVPRNKGDYRPRSRLHSLVCYAKMHKFFKGCDHCLSINSLPH
jgi:hypothetical protein